MSNRFTDLITERWRDFRCARGHHRWVEHNGVSITALGTYTATCRDCGTVAWEPPADRKARP